MFYDGGKQTRMPTEHTHTESYKMYLSPRPPLPQANKGVEPSTSSTEDKFA